MAESNLSSTIWAVANLLRGDYKQSDYGTVILPFTLLRRLDCVLADTKADVLAAYAKVSKDVEKVKDAQLRKASKQAFYNTSKMDLKTILGDPNKIRTNLTSYIQSFSEDARDIFDRYRFIDEIANLDSKNLLYKVAEEFIKIDLNTKKVSNTDMGLAFEELIRKFAELSNETAGEHFTPREVIKLMVNILFQGDDEGLSKPNVVRTIYDPTAGTGGMLSVAEEHLRTMNPKSVLKAFGQELNDQSFAICKADMLIKGQNVANIAQGNTLSEDKHSTAQFDYMLSNPPFGVEWKKVQKQVEDEHKIRGFAGRFGAGLPRVNDGSMLFLMHLLSKMRPVKEGGSRIGIVLNGSPLFTGGAGSGESDIRKWIIENDLLEGLIALPPDMFYNTGINTYIWILTNHKSPERKGKIQLVNAAEFFVKMKKSLGSKRKEISEEQVEKISSIYGKFRQGEFCKILKNEEFGYRTITVERPLLDEKGKPVKDKKGGLKADSKLRDTENVPLTEKIETYFKREVLPHVPDAWIDEDKTKVGYEIPFTRIFYKYQPPRSLKEIDKDLKAKVAKIQALLAEVSE
jgi:type I restriction enzyme M protein